MPSVAVNKFKNKNSQVFSQVVLHRVFLTGFFTGCDHVKSALFTGFEILDPVKKTCEKVPEQDSFSQVFSEVFSQVLFNRFFHRF